MDKMSPLPKRSQSCIQCDEKEIQGHKSIEKGGFFLSFSFTPSLALGTRAVRAQRTFGTCCRSSWASGTHRQTTQHHHILWCLGLGCFLSQASLRANICRTCLEKKHSFKTSLLLLRRERGIPSWWGLAAE